MRALIITVLCCCTGTNAYAQSLIGGGALYGGPSQAFVVCYAYNFGFPAQALNSAIFDENGNKKTLSYNSCGARLLPANGSCAMVANVSNNIAHSCYFQGSGSGGNIPNFRGTIQVLDANWHVLATSELR